MSLKEYGVYVLFYGGISEPCIFRSVMDLGKLFFVPGAELEHVCLCLKSEDVDIMYHVGKRQKSGWRKAKWFHNNFLPDKAIYFGRTSVDKEWIDSCPTIQFNFIKILLWYFVTRWFSDWMPKDNCTIVTCELLRELGFEVNDQVVPSLLWKDLEDADDNNSWSSRSW